MAYKTSATMTAKFLGKAGINLNWFDDGRSPKLLIAEDGESVEIEISEEKVEELKEKLG